MNDLFSRIFRAIVSISIIAPFQEKKKPVHIFTNFSQKCHYIKQFYCHNLKKKNYAKSTFFIQSQSQN